MINEPIFLAPNVMRRPYRGGERLAEFRGFPIAPGERLPEDWLASTTSVFGRPSEGLTRLADGSLLRDAIHVDPIAALGPEHVEVFGPDPALLVKLLDAQQRLSVHIHPDRTFARARLGVRYGKTEAWHILAVEPGAVVYLGFREAIEAEALREVVEGGSGSSLLGRMHQLSVSAGDTIFVPAGAPHAIGEGIFMVEAQEPSDLLVRLESSGYVVGGMPGDLGLGYATALQAVDRTAWTGERLAGLVRRHDARRDDLLPEMARGFFRIERLNASPEAEIGPGLRVLIVVSGTGSLRAGGRSLEIRAGQCLMIPWACGSVAVSGKLDVVCCRPADPGEASSMDPDLARFPTDHTHDDCKSDEGCDGRHQSCC